MFFLTRVRGVPELYPTRAIVVKLREVLDAIRKQGSWRPMSRGKFWLRSDFFVACCLKAKAFANSKAMKTNPQSAFRRVGAFHQVSFQSRLGTGAWSSSHVTPELRHRSRASGGRV